MMFSKLRVGTCLAGVAVAGAALTCGTTLAQGAAGAKQHTESFTAVAQLATFSSRHGYPAPHGTAVLAGPLIQHPGGQGAEVDHITITGQPAATTFTSRATGVDYLATGSERFGFISRITVLPGGALRLTGTGTVTGGTGAYHGITGRFTFTGGAASPSGIITYHARGSITVP